MTVVAKSHWKPITKYFWLLLKQIATAAIYVGHDLAASRRFETLLVHVLIGRRPRGGSSPKFLGGGRAPGQDHKFSVRSF